MLGPSLQPLLTRAVVLLRFVVWKVKETLDPVQGYFGLQEAIDHPGEVVERKNEQAHKCQCRKHLSGSEVESFPESCSQGRTPSLWTHQWRQVQDSSRHEDLARLPWG